MDRKFIKDLNRLIRRPVRKRLGVPPLRAAIQGGIGVAAEGVDDLPIEIVDGVYVTYRGDGVAQADTWFVPADGSTSTFVGNPGAYGGLGVIGNTAVGSADLFACVSISGATYKNGSVINSTNFSNGNGAKLGSSSTELYVFYDDNTQYYIAVLDLAGNYLNTIALPTDYVTQTSFCSNEVIFVYEMQLLNLQSRIAITDHAGVILGYKDYSNPAYLPCMAINKHVVAVPDYQSGNLLFDIFNNQGAMIAQHTIDFSTLSTQINAPDMQCFGLSDTALYIFGASDAQPSYAIYEHTITLDANGVATGATLGPYLTSAPCPNSNNLIYSWGVQTARMDSLLLV